MSERAAWNRTSKRVSSSPNISAVGGPLRHAHREHAHQTAAHREVLIRIDQRVDERADVLLGDLAQREHGVLGQRDPTPAAG